MAHPRQNLELKIGFEFVSNPESESESDEQDKKHMEGGALDSVDGAWIGHEVAAYGERKKLGLTCQTFSCQLAKQAKVSFDGSTGRNKLEKLSPVQTYLWLLVLASC